MANRVDRNRVAEFFEEQRRFDKRRTFLYWSKRWSARKRELFPDLPYRFKVRGEDDKVLLIVVSAADISAGNVLLADGRLQYQHAGETRLADPDTWREIPLLNPGTISRWAKGDRRIGPSNIFVFEDMPFTVDAYYSEMPPSDQTQSRSDVRQFGRTRAKAAIEAAGGEVHAPDEESLRASADEGSEAPAALATAM